MKTKFPTSPKMKPSLHRFRLRNDRDVFIALLGLYSLIIYPILRANRYYNDDLKRALIGHTGWDSNGRPLTTLLMKLMQCYDSALVDISPLTQIAAIAILAWIGVLISRYYAIRSPLIAALIAFPLGAQPFYLENLSYKFDALSMSMAILLALLPILVIGNHRRGWWLGVLSLFASLSFYQPAMNVYLIFVLLDLLLAQLHQERIDQWLRQFLLRVFQIGAALLFYQLIIGIHIHGWVGRESRKIDSIRELPLIAKNVGDFYRFIGNSFERRWWTYFLPLLIVLALLPVAVGMRYAKEQCSETGLIRAFLFLTSLLLPVAAIFCITGPMLLLLSPELEPRVLIGVGALLVAALITMREALASWHWSPRWLLFTASMLAVGMCSLASAYGNALGEQKNYEDRIGASLADDLEDAKAHSGIRGFLLDGTIGYSPITAHVAEEFPMIHSLISPYLASQDSFHTVDFLMYYVGGIKNVGGQVNVASVPSRFDILALAAKAPVVRNTSSYSLQVIDKIAVVTFHPASSLTFAPESHSFAGASRTLTSK